MDQVTPAPQVVPRRTLRGSVAGVYTGGDPKDLTSVVAAELRLDLCGVEGDRHYGFTRKAGPREPWYPRGTEIRSGRQVSVVSLEELAEVAERMNLPEVKPEWVGANLALAGIPRLSLLPPGTRLFFASKAALVVEGMNGPCRDAGRAIARHTAGPPDFEFLFPKVAVGLRGIVASVERPGAVTAATEVQVRVPEQRIYL